MELRKQSAGANNDVSRRQIYSLTLFVVLFQAVSYSQNELKYIYNVLHSVQPLITYWLDYVVHANMCGTNKSSASVFHNNIIAIYFV